MSGYGGQDLFGSGPHRFEVGGGELRHVVRDAPGGRGVELTGLGRKGREIKQTGVLVADDVAGLEARAEAIEAMLDGAARTLVDEAGREWPGVVMLAVERGVMERAGARWKQAYAVRYLQLVP